MEEDVISMFDEVLEATLDHDIEQVEDAAADVMDGESMDDGDIIDHVALTNIPSKIDKDVEDMVNRSEDDPVKALAASIGDPDAAVDYHDDGSVPEEDDPEGEGSIDYEDLENAIDEAVVDNYTVECILGGLSDDCEEG